MEYDIRPDESVSMAVVRAVSAMEDSEPDTLEPFCDVLDPDALDTIFKGHHDGSPRVGGHVSFIYSSCRVTIEHGEYLTVEKVRPEPRTRSESAGGA